MREEKKARFIKLLEQAPDPQLGDSSAMGTMFTRAFRYCEPMRLASESGWYIFSPVDIDLIFDGAATYWRLPEDTSWQKLQSLKDAHFRSDFEAACPSHLSGTTPITIGSSAEPGILQIWSGYILETAPGYSVLVRDPPNLPKLENFESYEGVIHSDLWFGPLLTNIRITKPDVVVSLRRNAPIFFVQMMRTEDCNRKIHQDYSVDIGLECFSNSDWQKYSRVMEKSLNQNSERGTYAREHRRLKRGNSDT